MRAGGCGRKILLLYVFEELKEADKFGVDAVLIPYDGLGLASARFGVVAVVVVVVDILTRTTPLRPATLYSTNPGY